MAVENSSLPVPQIPIQPEHKDVFTSINAFVHRYMSAYDCSHDYHHVLRVLSNANQILQAELKTNPSVTYDTSALFLSALLHDVGDRKYLKPGEDPETQIREVLLKHGADESLATKIQAIVKHVSYTTETLHPVAVNATLVQHPELAIVQDADRLDAIGAVGVARCFSFGAAKFPDQPMSRGIEHFEEKLYKLAGMMKTEAGREMARRRQVVLEEFAREFEVEAKLSFGFV